MHVIDVMVMEKEIVIENEAVLHVIDVMAIVIRSDGYCYRIETVMPVIDVMAMVMEVMDIVKGLKL